MTSVDEFLGQTGQGIDNASHPDYLIYFEPQRAALCGVHALNALLQGPFFTEVDCAEIAQQLDAQELALAAESGLASADFAGFATEESGNVSTSGMFSIQVLAKALEIWSLEAVPLRNPAAAQARRDPRSQKAFLCNLNEHWFAVRQVHGQWWDLNSLFAGPEPLSDFYLDAFLSSLQEQGYTIFVIQGHLPDPNIESSVPVNSSRGRWVSAAEARVAAGNRQRVKGNGILRAAAAKLTGLATSTGSMLRLRSRSPVERSAGVEAAFEQDDGLQLALAASMQEPMSDGETELAAAIAASLEDAHAPVAMLQPFVDEGLGASLPPTKELLDVDAGLPVLVDEPPVEVENAIEIRIRRPDGAPCSRRFSENSTVGQVAAFSASLGVDMRRHRLVTAFPRRTLTEMTERLTDVGLRNKDVLYIERM